MGFLSSRISASRASLNKPRLPSWSSQPELSIQRLQTSLRPLFFKIWQWTPSKTEPESYQNGHLRGWRFGHFPCSELRSETTVRKLTTSSTHPTINRRDQRSIVRFATSRFLRTMRPPLKSELKTTYTRPWHRQHQSHVTLISHLRSFGPFGPSRKDRSVILRDLQQLHCSSSTIHRSLRTWRTITGCPIVIVSSRLRLDINTPLTLIHQQSTLSPPARSY
jgi:hypothetical protein